MKIDRIHPITGVINTLDLNVTPQQILDHKNGEKAQFAFPNLTPDEREFIISGMLPGEWDETFPDI